MAAPCCAANRRGWRVCGITIWCVLLAAAFAFEETVLKWVATHRTPAALEFCGRVSTWAQWHWLILACLAVLGFAWLRNKHAWFRPIVAMMLAGSLAGLTVDLIRGLTGRVRPKAAVSLGAGWHGPWREGRFDLTDWNYNSFPSGHTTVTAALAAALWCYNRRAGWMLAPLPVVVAGARICVGAHYPSDVVAGAAVGTVCAIAVTRFMKSRPSSAAVVSDNAQSL